jgi:hypothetical protein
MNLPDLYKRVIKLTVDNGPAVLTSVAVAGTVATAYLTGRATFKAAEILGDEAEKRILHEREELRVFPTKDKIKLVWTQYLPPAGMAVTTIGCIVFANRISAKRLAAVAAAYSLSEKRFTEYKDKIEEKLGIQKEKAARDELAQDRVTAKPPTGQQIMVEGDEVICFENWTGRYFKSDMETLKKAQNDVNYQILGDGYATMADFYDKVGLESTKMANEMGWNLEHPMDLYFGTTLTDNGRPCIVVEYNTQPMPIRDRVFQAH